MLETLARFNGSLVRPNPLLLDLYLKSVKLENESVTEIDKTHHYTQDQLEHLPAGDAAFSYFSNELRRMRKAAYARATKTGKLNEALLVRARPGMLTDIHDLCSEFKLKHAPYRSASPLDQCVSIDISDMPKTELDAFYEYLQLAIDSYEFCSLSTCFR